MNSTDTTAPKKNYRAWHKIAIGFTAMSEWSVDEQCLRDLFNDFGPLADAVVRDYQVLGSRMVNGRKMTEASGCAYLYFQEANKAIQAVEAVNTADYNLPFQVPFGGETSISPLSRFRWIRVSLMDQDDPRLRDDSKSGSQCATHSVQYRPHPTASIPHYSSTPVESAMNRGMHGYQDRPVLESRGMKPLSPVYGSGNAAYRPLPTFGDAPMAPEARRDYDLQSNVQFPKRNPPQPPHGGDFYIERLKSLQSMSLLTETRAQRPQSGYQDLSAPFLGHHGDNSFTYAYPTAHAPYPDHFSSADKERLAFPSTRSVGDKFDVSPSSLSLETDSWLQSMSRELTPSLPLDSVASLSDGLFDRSHLLQMMATSSQSSSASTLVAEPIGFGSFGPKLEDGSNWDSHFRQSVAIDLLTQGMKSLDANDDDKTVSLDAVASPTAQRVPSPVISFSDPMKSAAASHSENITSDKVLSASSH